MKHVTITCDFQPMTVTDSMILWIALIQKTDCALLCERCYCYIDCRCSPRGLGTKTAEIRFSSTFLHCCRLKTASLPQLQPWIASSQISLLRSQDNPSVILCITSTKQLFNRGSSGALRIPSCISCPGTSLLLPEKTIITVIISSCLPAPWSA